MAGGARDVNCARLRSVQGGGCIAAFCERYTCNASCSLGVCSLQRRVISAYVTSVCAVGERVRVTVCVIALPFRFISLFVEVFFSPVRSPIFLVCLSSQQVHAHALYDARSPRVQILARMRMRMRIFKHISEVRDVV